MVHFNRPSPEHVSDAALFKFVKFVLILANFSGFFGNRKVKMFTQLHFQAFLDPV